MRNIKRFASTALAVALVAAMPLTAFAAPDGTEGAETTQESTVTAGALTVDPKVSISGLQPGDSVAIYKVLGWADNWVPAAGFESMESQLDEIAHGKVEVGEDGKEHTIPGALDSDLAGELGKLANGVAPLTTLTASEGGSVSMDIADASQAGLYMAIITSSVPGYVYNPVFVAADFNPNNEAGLTLAVDELSYSNQGRAKLNRTGVEKTADSITSDVEDEINFTVTTTVPAYAENYTHPVFRLTDILSDGLRLNAESITVSGEGLTEGSYTVSVLDDGRNGYVVDFDAAFMQYIESAIPVTITYKADITDATASVNPEDNTVTVNFSNAPTDETGAGIMRDRTNHYTFNIDGLLFGSDGYTNSEIIKIGVDANGNEITERVELDNGTSVGALEGAKFTLYTDEACTTVYKNEQFDGSEIVSTGTGHLPMVGLDAGTYYLKETEAPAGYIACQDVIKIEIVANETEIKVEEKEGEVDVTYMMNVLESYQIFVTIGNGERVETASYQLVNDGQILDAIVPGDHVGETEWGGKIINTVGVELPSTGGVGTTIFYVVGSVLVLGAGVLLVAKKRMGGSKDEA